MRVAQSNSQIIKWYLFANRGTLCTNSNGAFLTT